MTGGNDKMRVLKEVFNLTPDQADGLLQSPEAALDMLVHKDGRMRQAAIWACSRVWQLDSDSSFLQRCTDMCRCDEAWGVRCDAVAILSLIFEGTKYRNLQQVLREIVADEGEVAIIRNVAYRGIVMIESGWTLDLAERAIHDCKCLMAGTIPLLEKWDGRLLSSLDN